MKIQWTKSAEKNLIDIKTYISQDKPKAAIKTVLQIIKTIELLLDHPSAGRPGRIMGTRELIINGTSYIVPYRVKNETIEILRVFHTAMQWPGNVSDRL